MSHPSESPLSHYRAPKLIFSSQQLLIFGVGAIVILVLAAGMDIVIRFLPFHSFFRTAFTLLTVLTVGPILAMWKGILDEKP